MSSYEFVLVETSSFPEIATYSFQLEKLFMEHKAHLKIGVSIEQVASTSHLEEVVFFRSEA